MTNYQIICLDSGSAGLIYLSWFFFKGDFIIGVIVLWLYWDTSGIGNGIGKVIDFWQALQLKCVMSITTKELLPHGQKYDPWQTYDWTLPQHPTNTSKVDTSDTTKEVWLPCEQMKWDPWWSPSSVQRPQWNVQLSLSQQSKGEKRKRRWALLEPRSGLGQDNLLFLWSVNPFPISFSHGPWKIGKPSIETK